MNIPKILPWVARKSGISDELAIKLWRRAASEVENLLGESKSSNYFKRAVERFLDLAEAEATALPDGLTQAPRLSWYWRHQNRMSMLSLNAAENACHAWKNTWSQLFQPKKVA